MTIKGNLNKDQAINTVGVDAVNNIDYVNCEPTGRVGYNGACQGDSLTEWTSYVSCKDNNGDNVTLSAYYYTTNDQDQMIADTGDGGCIDWVIEGYEVF